MVVRENIEIDDIPIILEWKKMKNLRIRVLPDATVKVSSPNYISRDSVNEFILDNIDWIKEKREDMLKNPQKPEIKYKDGEIHYIWGEPYTLRLIDRDLFNKDSLTMDGSLINNELSAKNNLCNNFYNKAFYDSEKAIIYLPVPKRSKIEYRKNLILELYRDEMNKNIPYFLDKSVSIVGEKPKGLKIRKMKNWGNCRRDGRVTLNLNLAKKDPICLEYVLIHELCHLIEFNHSKRFKNLMDKFCPDWKDIKKLLNQSE